MIRAIWTLKILLSHWTRHPMQLATLLIGLMSATALWSGVPAINAQARSSYDRAAATFGGSNTATLVPSHDATVPQSLFAELRRAGWLACADQAGSFIDHANDGRATLALDTRIAKANSRLANLPYPTFENSLPGRRDL
jgi:hypothetical protein